MKFSPTIFIGLGLILALPLAAATIHVPGDQPTIQAGIDAAVRGDTVLVADGTYTGDGNRDISFQGKAITVRSENGPGNCSIDCQGSAVSPHRGVIFDTTETADSVLEGFTIKNGYADHDDYQLRRGGAIFCDGSSPRITGNVLTGNHAVISGGAIYCMEAHPLIEGNVISGNTAVSRGGAIAGVLSSPSIIGNTIEGNTSAEGGALMFDGPDNSPLIRGNSIRANVADSGGGIYCIGSSGLQVMANTISDNHARGSGGGILCDELTDPQFIGNHFVGNHSYYNGGAIYCNDCRNLEIRGNSISANTNDWGASGIYLISCSSSGAYNMISDNDIFRNHGDRFSGAISMKWSSAYLLENRIFENNGDAIFCEYENWGGLRFEGNRIFSNDGAAIRLEDCNNPPKMINNLIYRNDAYYSAIYISGCGSNPVIRSCTIVDNPNGSVSSHDCPAVEISNSILWGNGEYQIYGDADVVYSDVEYGHPGVGNIDEDPLFSFGSSGEYCLSQIAAGQPVDSPCMDSANPAGDMIEGTTRTDGMQDEGILDMGYHSSFTLSCPLVATGPGPGASNPPLVRLFPLIQYSEHEYEFEAYGPDQYGVNVTCGNVDMDSADEIITGAGPGAVYGPHVRGFRSDGTPLDGLNFLAYGTNKYGVNVATGDIDADGFDEIITGAGPGEVFGPHVRAWDYDGSSLTPFPGVSFFAYGTPKWGVNVSAGDIDGDGYDEIVTGPGPGAVYGPHVRAWNIDGNPSASAIPEVSYFAYGTLKYGVNVSCGDVDGDGIDEIVTGAGPGAVFGPHIRGWNYDGNTVSPLPGFSLFAWLTGSQSYGVNVHAGTDVNHDGLTDVIAGRGPDPQADTQVKIFSYTRGEVVERMAIDAFEGMTHGTNVAAGRF